MACRTSSYGKPVISMPPREYAYVLSSCLEQTWYFHGSMQVSMVLEHYNPKESIYEG